MELQRVRQDLVAEYSHTCKRTHTCTDPYTHTESHPSRHKVYRGKETDTQTPMHVGSSRTTWCPQGALGGRFSLHRNSRKGPSVSRLRKLYKHSVLTSSQSSAYRYEKLNWTQNLDLNVSGGYIIKFLTPFFSMVENLLTGNGSWGKVNKNRKTIRK